MKANMGKTDRLIRTVIALVLGVLIGTGTISGTLAYIALAFGIIFVATSFISFCPLYTIFGINTCTKNKV